MKEPLKKQRFTYQQIAATRPYTTTKITRLGALDIYEGLRKYLEEGFLGLYTLEKSSELVGLIFVHPGKLAGFLTLLLAMGGGRDVLHCRFVTEEKALYMHFCYETKDLGEEELEELSALLFDSGLTMERAERGVVLKTPLTTLFQMIYNQPFSRVLLFNILCAMDMELEGEADNS